MYKHERSWHETFCRRRHEARLPAAVPRPASAASRPLSASHWLHGLQRIHWLHQQWLQQWLQWLQQRLQQCLQWLQQWLQWLQTSGCAPGSLRSKVPQRRTRLVLGRRRHLPASRSSRAGNIGGGGDGDLQAAFSGATDRWGETLHLWSQETPCVNTDHHQARAKGSPCWARLGPCSTSTGPRSPVSSLSTPADTSPPSCPPSTSTPARGRGRGSTSTPGGAESPSHRHLVRRQGRPVRRRHRA